MKKVRLGKYSTDENIIHGLKIPPKGKTYAPSAHKHKKHRGKYA